MDPHRKKWNGRYAQHLAALALPQRPDAHPLAVCFMDRIPEGRMLDAACGLGRGIASAGERIRAIYAIDFSEVAIRVARRIWAHNPRVRWIVADVTTLRFPERYFSLVCAFGFTDWTFLNNLGRILIPGGVLLYEGFSSKQLEANPNLDPDWTASVEALQRAFGGWTVLACGETGPAPYRVHLAAIRPDRWQEDRP